MNSEETLRQNDDSTKLILEAIGGLRQEMSHQITQQISDLRREMNEQFAIIKAENEQIKDNIFSLDVRLERVQAMAHGGLNIGHDLKADVKILHAEVRAWAQDVLSLEKRFV